MGSYINLVFLLATFSAVHVSVATPKISHHYGLCFQSYIEYDAWINVELHHALDSDDPDIFKYRANITIPSLNSGLSNVVQEDLSNEDVEKIKV